MKTALKTASTAIKRWLALCRMRSIEINLSGAIDTLYGKYFGRPSEMDRTLFKVYSRP